MAPLSAFDAIVVGAGAAGCVVAGRLAGDGQRVLLAEAGPGVMPPAVISVEALTALDEPGWLWPAVQAEHGHRASVYRQGRGVGGGTAVNSLVLSIGDRADYDRWARDANCPGWDWSAMEPWFATALQALRPETVPLGPLAAALSPVVAAHGHPTGGRTTEVDASGYLAADLAVGRTAAGLRRRSAADSHLRVRPDGSTAPTLAVRADAAVARVLLDGNRARGVVFDDGSTVVARRVVLSAGAIASPSLLRASGVHHLAIGETVRDHPSFVFTVALRTEDRRPPTTAVPPVTAMLRWSSGTVPTPAGGVRNDLAAHVLDHVGSGADGRRHGAVIVMLTDVESVGSLPLDAPQVDDDADRAREAGFAATPSAVSFRPGWLTASSDRARLVAAVRHVGSLLADRSLAAANGGPIEQVYIDDRGTPLTDLEAMTDGELEQWLVDHPGPVSHVASTLPLDLRSPSSDHHTDRSGTDRPLGPIGPAGAVRSVERLHVVDASILPLLPTANTQLPVMAVAERISSELLTR